MITTHVLDTAHGRPAEGVDITLFKMVDGKWEFLARGSTNANGRLTDLLTEESVETGLYKLVFETAAYFGRQHTTGFYPYIPLVFEIHEANTHYHVPLLLSPFGYSTYRGS